MNHAKNIAGFVAAAKGSADSLTEAYCGLVAIELTLKQDIALTNHDVPSAVNRFASKYAIHHKAGCKVRLNTLATQLHNAIGAISVQGKDSNPRSAPGGCYPYIRYARHASDMWPAPSTSDAQALILSGLVMQVRSYLANKFGKNL